MKKHIRLLFMVALSKYDEEVTPSLSPAYLAAYLKKNYGNVSIKIVEKNYKKAILSFKPDIAGIYSVSKNYNLARALSRLCRQHKLFNIIGGPHITSLPESLDKNTDLGVLAEGEKTLLEIVNNINNGTLKKNIGSIKGIVYWKNGNIARTPKRELIENLDELPYPAWDLLDFRKDKAFPIMTTRGCPYNCRFCANRVLEKKVRFFSAEYVYKQIKEVVKKYNPYYIQIWDDLFIANKKRLYELTNLLKKDGLNRKVKFVLLARADMIDDKTVKALKEMGTHEVGMGLESGSEKILNYLKYGTITVKQNIKAIEILKKYKIRVTGFFIIGAPIDTKKTILETLRFIKKYPLDVVNVYQLVPYPGTEIWDYALRKGLVSNDMDWSILDRSSLGDPKAIYLCENLKRQEFQEIVRKFKFNDKIRRIKQIFLVPLRDPKRVVFFINDYATTKMKNILSLLFS